MTMKPWSLVRVATILCVLGGAPVAADELDDVLQQEVERTGIPSVSFAVAKDGAIVRSGGYGFADVEKQVPATSATPYQIGSVTKQFTAAIVLMLAQEGKLDLSDPIGKYLEDIPEEWQRATVRQVLNHTSGIGSYTSHPMFVAVMRQPASRERIIEMTPAALAFEPGEKMSYSNTGYVLLGWIIEEVEGKSYEQVVQERIAEPARLTSTAYGKAPEGSAMEEAKGYALNGAAVVREESIDMSWPGAAGGLVSTAGDVVKWNVAVAKGEILEPQWSDELTSPVLLTNGESSDYGMGYIRGDWNGRTIYAHGGGIPGFASYMVRVPEKDLTIAVLANTLQSDLGSIARKIATHMEPELAPKPLEGIADEHPEVTAKAKGLVERITAASIKEEEFTEELAKIVFASHLQASEYFKSFGAIQSVNPVEAPTEVNGALLHHFGVQFEEGAMLMDVSWNEEGLIHMLRLKPAQN